MTAAREPLKLAPKSKIGTLDDGGRELRRMLSEHEKQAHVIGLFAYDLQQDHKHLKDTSLINTSFTEFLTRHGIKEGSIRYYLDIGMALRKIEEQHEKEHAEKEHEAEITGKPKPEKKSVGSTLEKVSNENLRDAGKALRGSKTPKEVKIALENGTVADVASAAWNDGLVPLMVTVDGKGLMLEAVKFLRDAHRRAGEDNLEMPESLALIAEIFCALESEAVEHYIKAGTLTSGRTKLLERAVQVA